MVDFSDPRGFFVEHIETDLCVEFQVSWTFFRRA